MTDADEGEAGAAGSHPGRVLAIPDRTESDLDECVRLLAEVHRSDGYPLRWPADPRRFLDTPKIVAAWVATLDGQVVGHVALSVVSPDDAAPRLLGVTSEPPRTDDRDTGSGASSGDAADKGGLAGGSGASSRGGGSAEGDLAGSGTVGDSAVAGAGEMVMISRLFVGTAARGYGAGRALMERAVQGAHERSLHPLLDVHTANTSAIALYERLGWNFLGTSHAQWGPDQVTIRSYTAPTRHPAGP